MSDTVSVILFVGGIAIFLASLLYAREFLRFRAENRQFQWNPDPRADLENVVTSEEVTELDALSKRLVIDAETLRSKVDALEARRRQAPGDPRSAH